MIIDEQLELFFRRYRQARANADLTDDNALAYINDARASLAVKIRFFRIDDKITATGGETYWTMKQDFEPLEIRDWATCNGIPIIIKSMAEWETLVSSGYIGITNEVWGVLDKGTFRRYPAAVVGDLMRWKGTGAPPALPDTTGPDVYLYDAEARLAVLEAVITAIEDNNGTPGPVLLRDHAELKGKVEKNAKPRGARLHNAAD